MKCPVSGIVPAIITPFTKNGRSVDFEKAGAHAVNLAGKGVNGLFVCGTTGEGLLMTPDERTQLTRELVSAVGKKVKIVAQTGCLDTPTTLQLTADAFENGAHAVGVYTPAFYTYDDAALTKFYRQVARAAAGKPVLLYNIPQMTGNPLSPGLVAKLAEDIDNIVGIKDSSGDFNHLTRLIDRTPKEFAVFNGADEYSFQAYASGVSGSVSGTANFVPELLVRIYQAMSKGDVKRARETQVTLARACSLIEYGSSIALYKEAVRLRGGDGGFVRPPQRELTRREKGEFARRFRDAQLA